MTRSVTRRSIKFLIAVWGPDYIARLDRFGFSSLLAAGNLPALARDHDVEFVLLTTTDSIPYFEAAPLIGDIRKHASIRYVPIDDLITPRHFTTTLHLAFTRGVTVFGDDMLNMSFVFWNADFVLANGSLAHLSKLIIEGHRVIINGTLRATAEDGEGLLEAMRDPMTGVLSAGPRELVDICFRFGHPHHAAKTVNQNASWSLMASQMLWRVSPTTLLARYFQSFMFCLSPTRVVTSINGPCDYAFVPELCPGEPQYLIDDSDDSFILEIQPRGAEAEFIRFGAKKEDKRRGWMSEWLTAEHLDTGRRVVTIRSGDPPPSDVLARAHTDFQAYFDGFMQHMPKPLTHKAQYYWLYGVADWFTKRFIARRLSSLPPELETELSLEDLNHPSNIRHRQLLTVSTKTLPSPRSMLFGQPYFPGSLHPDAASTRTLRKVGADAMDGVGKSDVVLVVSPLGTTFDIMLPMSRPNTYWFEILPARVFKLTGPPVVKSVVVYVNSLLNNLDAASLLERIAPVLADGALVQMVWHNPGMRSDLPWVEISATHATPLADRLEDFDLSLVFARRRDLRFSRRLYEAMPHYVDPELKPKMGARFIAAAALLLRATGLGSWKFTGVPRVVVAKGRYRRHDAKAGAAKPQDVVVETRRAS